MKISPTVLSVAALPCVTLWIISSIIHNFYQAKGDTDALPDVWLAIFAVGGPLGAIVVVMMVTARLLERQKFTTIDKLAIWVSVIGAVFWVGSLVYAFFQPTH